VFRLEIYEKILATIALLAGVVIIGYFVYAVAKDMRTPINVKWVYNETGRFEGVVIA
jgi:hypothetical protein